MSADSQEFTSFEAPPLEELDSLLEGYHFESFIAQGGMGAVYLARQISLDREVAVKVLPREFGEDASFRESFQSEAKLMAKLNHINLIGIYDFGDIDGMLYIIMEYVKGKSLHDLAYGKAIKQETAVEIIGGICSGLSHAHQAGILHRDIKPANILLGKKAVPKVGDFGLARPSGNTESGVIYGTPGYSAPEVLGAPDKVDHRTDIFAVGVMFYELLTGNMPGDSYVSVTEFAGVDRRFDKIIQKAIHPDIESRHDSAEEFKEAIDAVIGGSSPTNKLLVTDAPQGATARVAVLGKTGKVSSKVSSKPSAAPVVMSPNAGGNVKMMRNVVIIFLLLGAIYAVLEMKDAKEEGITKQQEIATAEEAKRNKGKQALLDLKAEERRRDAAARAAEENPNKSRGADGAVMPPPVVVKLSPMEQLEKIKGLLRNGERPMMEMPDTIFMRDQDSRIIMYIDKKMSWDDADTWARKRGGYLAVCRSKSDITVLMKEIPADAGDVWLGAGCSGDKGWSWVDDTEWTNTVDIKSTYNRAFAKVSKYGSVGKAGAEKKLNFFIEWRADGSNPAELKYRLLRASDTLTDINPKYPPGTITAGARNYAIIKDPVTYSEAEELAIASGGHLIAISNDDEKYEVEGIVEKCLQPDETLWTAGMKQNEMWGWQTGEEWLSLNWVTGHPKERKHVVIFVSQDKALQFKDFKSDWETNGFIIEWSQDQSRVKVAGMDTASSETFKGLSSLKSKAKLLITKQREATEKKHAANIKKLWSDLETYLRILPKNEGLQQSKAINQIITLVKDKSRIPSSVTEQGSSKKARDYTNYAIEKQARITSEHKAQMKLLRAGYVKQLEKLKRAMQAKGQASAEKAIIKEAEDIGLSVGEFEKHFE